jgi:hypothetical protein
VISTLYLAIWLWNFPIDVFSKPGA